MSPFARIIVVALLLAANTGAMAKSNSDIIVFATAPTHSRHITEKAYTPLLDYLSRATGKQFRLSIPPKFNTYSDNIRQGTYDMVFDGPHYTSWRMVKQNYTPIVRFPGEIKIVVATKKESKFNSLDDLNKAYVCAFPPPNMLTMAFLSYFPNNRHQLTLMHNKGFKKLLDCIKQDRGDAVIFRDKLWNKLDKEDKANLRLIAQPEAGYPERTFSVGPNISHELRQKITDALMSEEGIEASKEILTLFKKKKLVHAKSEEYTNLDRLLEGIWGF